MDRRAKSLVVQIQPGRSPGLDAEAAVARLQAVASASVSRGEDAGPYINVGFQAADLSALWAAVREVVRDDAALAKCVIACCEGDRGWDDYLLLHHFDPLQSLQEPSHAEPGAAPDPAGS